jgi:hypothetical protein
VVLLLVLVRFLLAAFGGFVGGLDFVLLSFALLLVVDARACESLEERRRVCPSFEFMVRIDAWKQCFDVAAPKKVVWWFERRMRWPIFPCSSDSACGANGEKALPN